MARRRPLALAVALVPAAILMGGAAFTASAEPGPHSFARISVAPAPRTVAPPVRKVGAAPVTATPSTARGERNLARVYVTGYTWFDNTPRGSSAISHPVVHRTAGGTGAYTDPVTVAVGHSRSGGREVLDLPRGTRLYFGHLRRYGIVEDTCGDGPSPQSGPCHSLAQAPRGATLWVDVYVGGGPRDSESLVSGCAGKITDGDGRPLRTVVVNPRPGLVVQPGLPFSQGRCTPLFG